MWRNGQGSRVNVHDQIIDRLPGILDPELPLFCVSHDAKVWEVRRMEFLPYLSELSPDNSGNKACVMSNVVCHVPSFKCLMIIREN